MGWQVEPDGLREMLLLLQRDYAPREIVITENGAAYADAVASDGQVHDADRQRYLARHVGAMLEAMAAGVPVTGYHAWSLLDNFEWSLGYGKRFGLVHVDFETQRRTIKQSGRWYRALIERAGSGRPAAT
jgi:beta-glucosidase